jgi:hypothetical protein
MSNSDEQIQKLTETIAALSDALAKSERCYRSTAQVHRWMGVGLAGLFALVLWLGFDAVRATESGDGNIQPVVTALNDINSNLTAIVKGMQGMGALMSQVGPVLSDVKNITAGIGQGMPKLQPSMADAATLIARLKEDSDYARGMVPKGKPPIMVALELQKISAVLSAVPTMAAEMHRMNIAMSAVPPMVAEMHQMNLSMGIMSKSIGSTMGRMGSMIPF